MKPDAGKPLVRVCGGAGRSFDIFNIFTKYKENIIMVRSIRPNN
jgi:hypothetical protein